MDSMTTRWDINRYFWCCLNLQDISDTILKINNKQRSLLLSIRKKLISKFFLYFINKFKIKISNFKKICHNIYTDTDFKIRLLQFICQRFRKWADISCLLATKNWVRRHLLSDIISIITGISCSDPFPSQFYLETIQNTGKKCISYLHTIFL